MGKPDEKVKRCSSRSRKEEEEDNLCLFLKQPLLVPSLILDQSRVAAGLASPGWPDVNPAERQQRTSLIEALELVKGTNCESAGRRLCCTVFNGRAQQ